MPTHVKTIEKAIGYIRISTDMQNVEDSSFGCQESLIREACARRGVSLLEIYEEVGSAAAQDSVQRRKGLQAAIRRAKEEGAMLVVAEPTRLFRNVESVRHWFANVDVKIFSVRHGGILGRTALKKIAQDGANFAAKTRAGTSAAKSSEAISPSSPGGYARQLGQRNSEINRKLAAQERAKQVSVIIEEHSSVRLSHQELADVLNERSIQTEQKTHRTSTNVRRTREAAEQVLAEQRDLESMPFFPHESELPSGDALKPSAQKEGQVVLGASDKEDEEERALRALPTFGMF